MRLPFTIAATFILAAISVHAAETPWQEVAPGVKLRLISTGQFKANGTALIGLEIDMPASTKTYWRVPGETGLPTEIDIEGSSGVVGHQILWPYPVRDQTEDYLDYVYYGPVVLPIELQLDGSAAQLELAAVLGVCSDICIPVQARFSLPLTDAEVDRPNGLRIRQALANSPIPWQGDPQPVGDAEYLPETQMLAVHVGSDLDPASLIAATADGQPLFGAPQKSPQPDLVLMPVLEQDEGADLVGRDVQLTFMTGMGAFEVTRTIQPASD